jgi:methyl-accepting chemotaxis protein
MSLKTRIWMLPAMAAAIFLIGGALVVLVSSAADRAITSLGRTDYPYLDQITRFAGQLQTLQGIIAGAVAQGEKARLADAEELAGAMRKTLTEIGADEGHEEEGKKLGGQFDSYYASAVPTARIFLGLDKGDATVGAARMQEALRALNQTVDGALKDAKEGFDKGLERAKRGVDNGVLTMVAAAIAVVVALGGSSYLLVRSIWGQIGGEPEYARTVLRALAHGDLAQDVEVQAGAESSVLAAVRDMAGGLSNLISAIRVGAESITSASTQVAAGNEDLSSRTEQQASSLRTMASSIEELTSTVAQSAQNAKQATQLANLASAAADNGGAVVGKVVTTMNEILASSKRISEIISVIDSIAFQTNILALNAAVEAARAGEQGRGFAVVASEVRNLAQRSAQAAREIKSMISESVEKVDAGSLLVNQAGTSMVEIVAQVKLVKDLIGEISAAATEQSAGIARVNEAVTRMDQTTQRNAALVEESAAAAESLKGESGKLAGAVSVFRTGAARAEAASA